MRIQYERRVLAWSLGKLLPLFIQLRYGGVHCLPQTQDFGIRLTQVNCLLPYWMPPGQYFLRAANDNAGAGGCCVAMPASAVTHLMLFPKTTIHQDFQCIQSLFGIYSLCPNCKDRAL